MSYPLRIQEPGYVFHVICKGNNIDLFRESRDYCMFLSLIDKERSIEEVLIYNYVLMSNHIHLLLEPRSYGGLSRFMQNVTKKYAKYYNKCYERSGHVFQRRFKSLIVQTERYFLGCLRYIDLNPVKAGMVDDPSKYTWSGYHHLALGRATRVKLDNHDVYMGLGRSTAERRSAYRRLVFQYPGEDLDLLTHKGFVLGTKQFKAKLKSFFKKGI